MDYLLLLSSIVLGAACVFLFKLDEPRHVKLLNTFIGAYLLALTLLHLLPELYHHQAPNAAGQDLTIGALILAGFFAQVALDFISMGVEHGHAHAVHGRMSGIVAGLCLHALVEAMALGKPETHFDPPSRRLLLWSIVLHNFPVSIALLGMLLHSGLRRVAALCWLGLFAAMAPLGLGLSSHLAPLAAHSRELMAVVIGIFMHISTTILFETSDLHRFNLVKLVAILVGTGLGIASVMFH